MKKLLLITLSLTMIFGSCISVQKEDGTEPIEYAVIIHGGAGVIAKEKIGADSMQYKASLQAVIEYAHAQLETDKPILDVLTETIALLENDSLFNAGKGAVLTSDGIAELDASIMEGADRNAGAVAGLKHVKNPIKAARMVMEESEHVMLVGEGAEQFVFQNSAIDSVSNDYFLTSRRRAQWEKSKMGTVGCVIYKNGEIVAATSTGGMMNKQYGRVGDAPIIGAGTYAQNSTCGLSATGHGEYFIRGNITADISARMEYGGMELNEAMETCFSEKLDPLNGTGGVIGIDHTGRIFDFRNTNGMFRAYTNSIHSKPVVKIWE